MQVYERTPRGIEALLGGEVAEEVQNLIHERVAGGVTGIAPLFRHGAVVAEEVAGRFERDRRGRQLGDEALEVALGDRGRTGA